MIAFIIAIIVWLVIGIIGLFRARKYDRPNYEIIIFMMSLPFLPLIALAYNLI